MKIAQVSPYDINRPGGVQRHICDLSAALIKLGHEVTIIAPRIDCGIKADCAGSSLGAAAVNYVGKGWLISLNGTQFEITLALGEERARLDRIMQDGGFYIVHFHTLISPLLPFQVFRRSRCATIATFHNVPPDGASGLIQRSLQGVVVRRLMMHLDDVIFASHVQRRFYSISQRPPVSVLPPCINLRRFDASAEPIAQNRGERLTILFLGRLEPRKGAIVLLQAYRELIRLDLSARLLIGGDGPERSSLEQFVRTHSIPNVTFLGIVPDADLPHLYATADIFCAPSLYGEGFGIVIAEAMASGRPVVAAANDGYRTLLTGEAADFLVQPGDVGGTRSKLAALLSDATLRGRLGDWGRREAKRYDSQALAPSFVAIYERAARSRMSVTSQLVV